MAMGMLQTKNRIRSVTSTKKITKAMELVATSKLKKAKEINFQLNPYKNGVMEVLSYCALNVKDKDYHYFKENATNSTLFVIITSTLGLCGGYNVAIEKFASNNIDINNDELIVLGSKGIHYFKDKKYKVIKEIADLPTLNLKENLSKSLVIDILQDFDLGKYKNVQVIYTKFVNSLTFVPTTLTLLPITNVVEVPKISKDLLLEPSANEVLDSLVPFYLQTSLKALIFESILSEQASRRTAMETATDNASELEDKLVLEFNKSRQAAITQEITEISSAANTLK